MLCMLATLAFRPRSRPQARRRAPVSLFPAVSAGTPAASRRRCVHPARIAEPRAIPNHVVHPAGGRHVVGALNLLRVLLCRLLGRDLPASWRGCGGGRCLRDVCRVLEDLPGHLAALELHPHAPVELVKGFVGEADEVDDHEGVVEGVVRIAVGHRSRKGAREEGTPPSSPGKGRAPRGP